ncbi:Ig-like domain-containing protein [Pontibacillus sp. ALD_SL1]|uniref:Ig-like domain-containing protein n=1 Tax=Pontibacillus sp. ALD_SL1 TaxID=2777185 RepID=UPI001A96B5CA|nr:Ig-like domain-containing protein [Pontibacillus sp. ALD_SL1]QSS99713.1 Ig-like domain-containing protein [Pontibacillus sp. ALD_SL1]
MRAMKWLIVSFMLVLGLTTSVSAEEETYEELSVEEKHKLLTEIAIEKDIPPEILKAIAAGENNMMQFKEDGTVQIVEDGGIGIMQITNHDLTGVDKTRLATDTEYNIRVGADILNQKWDYFASNPALPIINGASNRHILEQWYFAIMAYNGYSNLNNPDRDYENGEKPYQEKVFTNIKKYSGVSIAAIPEDFSFDTEDGFKSEQGEYSWNGANSYTTQMFQPGDQVYVMNNYDLSDNYDYGNLRTNKSFTSSPVDRVPYYSELEIVSGPYYPTEWIYRHFVAYEVKSDHYNGYVASANLRNMEQKEKEFDPKGEQMTEVSLDKTWKIEMNTEIDPATVNERNVYIVSDDGKGVRIDLSLSSDQTMITATPEGEYDKDTEYALYVKGLKSTEGEPLGTNVFREFKTVK